MKKSRILGYALTLAATLMVGSAMGQANLSNVNIVKIEAGDEAKAYVTKGHSAWLYVQPDLFFHPAYDATGSWTLSSNSFWKWAVDDETFASTPYFTSTTATPQNWVEIKNDKTGTTGVKKISVAEVGVGATSCAGSINTIDLVVLPTPTIIFDQSKARPIATTGCGEATDHQVVLNLTSADYPHVKFQYSEYDVKWESGAPKTYVKAGFPKDVVLDFNAKALYTTGVTSQGFTWKFATSFVMGTSTDNAAGTITSDKKTLTFNPTTGVTDAIATLYEFKLVKTDATHGISDFVTRKSQHDKEGAFSGTYTVYNSNAADDVLAVYVKTSPRTGPVYHISNNVAK